MKTIFITLATAITVLMATGLAMGSEPKGLLIYTDHPSTYVEACEFSALDTGKPLYSTIVRADGQRLQITNGGLWIVVDYPPLDPQADTQDVANANLEKISGLIRQYPQVKAQLVAVQTKWKNALALAKQMSAVEESRKITLTCEGVEYHGVILVSVEDENVGITYSDGVATLPLGKLTKEQIAALNTTSTTIDIDPDWAAKKQQKMEEEARATALKLQQAEAEEKQRLAEEKIHRASLLEKGKNLEIAAKYDDALEIFTELNSTEDIERVEIQMAYQFEKKKDYASAAAYFDKAGDYQNAGRIRKTYDLVQADSVSKLIPEEIFKRCAPACVTIVTGNNGEIGLGSGFFVAKGGYILTNHHVIDGAELIKVITSDKRVIDARVVETTSVPDVAVLKADIIDNPVLNLGDSEKIENAARVATIGSPEGHDQSYTAGNISNTNRKYEENNCFQISVLINHGNSGGPLIDETGHVIGITTFGEGTAGTLSDGQSIGSDVQGINYAVKINEAKQLLQKAIGEQSH